MVIFVTIPFACGHFLSIGVLEKVGLGYFKLDFLKRRFLRVDCKHVAIFINLGVINDIIIVYITSACQDIPSQYINNDIDIKTVNSRTDKSVGIFFVKV